MTRTRRAITLLTLWLAIFFAGPVVPALAASRASFPAASAVIAATDCPMKRETARPNGARAAQLCCCCPPERASQRGAAVTRLLAPAKHCSCSARQGVPVTHSAAVFAPLPNYSLALFQTAVSAVVPPLAHLAARAPLPPFTARLQIPQRARDAGRAPPTR